MIDPCIRLCRNTVKKFELNENNTMKYFAIIISVITCFSTIAQDQKEIQFIPIQEKLSQNTVTTVLQDKKGFLWIGTRNGLNKYDGINVQNYSFENRSKGLSNAYINDIFQDNEGALWIATYGEGLFKYDEYSDEFIQFKNVVEDYKSLSDNFINAIYQDQDGTIWIGTENGGLNRYDPSTNHFSRYKHNDNDPFSISSNQITDILEDQDRNLWISTWGGGLNLFDKKSLRFIHYSYEEGNSKSLSSNDINKLILGVDNVIWIATQNGLNRLKHSNDGLFEIEVISIETDNTDNSYNVVLSVLEDDRGLWVGTENGGIKIINLEDGSIESYVYDSHYENSIQSNSIWTLYKDDMGIIWVGTFNKGLFKVDQNHTKFDHVKHNPLVDNSITNNSISAFAEDKEGNIWIGTDGGGLNYWDVANGKFTRFRSDRNKKGTLSSDAVLSLLIDKNENLWIGTWQGGVNILKKDRSDFENFDLDLSNSSDTYNGNIFSLLEDSKGRIWIAVYRNGVYIYDPETEITKELIHEEANYRSLSNNLVRNIVEDERGTIWIGTEGGGLNKCIETNGEFYFEHFKHDDENDKSISNNIVYSLLVDSADNLWVGTSDGLNLFDKDKYEFSKIGKETGLPNEVILGIIEGDSSQLWISTNNGLSRYGVNDQSIRNYDESDGLQSLEFSKNSFLKLKNGEVLFGGINGFNKFLPANIKDSESTPPVYITDFSINNKSVKPGINSPLKRSIINTKRIDLNSEQNDMSFGFAILSFSQSGKSTYAYQLENYDDNWQNVGTRRNAYYTNVPPGYYVFKVKATNSDGKWSDKIASVEIVISPPWYNTYWAYSLFIIIITGILVLGIQMIVNRERLQNQINIDHSKIMSMQEVHQMKTRFFANISHEFRSPLTLILGPLKSLAENPDFSSSKKQIDMMIRNAQRLLNLINQLLELSKIESGNMKLETSENDIVKFLKPIVHSFNSLSNKKFISYNFDFPKEKLMVYFDREKLEKIIANLLSNAIKYTPDFGKINVRVHSKNDKVIIEVEDNGIGIPEDEMEFVFNRYYRVNSKESKKNKGTGIGLSLTKELVTLHKGEIELESKVGKGAVFKIHLPLGKEHLDESEIIESGLDFMYNNEKSNKEIEKSNDSNQEMEVDGFPIVLIIEDNDDIRMYVADILKENYRVLQADNGSDGLKLALDNIPDLIISDIMMPGLDGYELCRKVKTDVKTSHIPVVLLTAKASNDSALTGFEMGADYFIIKPFNPKILLLRIRNMLKSRDVIKENILKKETLNINPKNVQITTKDEDFIKKAVQIVEENMTNSNFYVEDLGKELGLSRMQLYRKLKGLIGQSANEFTRSIRLKRAAQLIEQDTLTISEVTYEVGFTDLQYFRDCFKKQFGVNPTEYLKNLQKNES